MNKIISQTYTSVLVVVVCTWIKDCKAWLHHQSLK